MHVNKRTSSTSIIARNDGILVSIRATQMNSVLLMQFICIHRQSRTNRFTSEFIGKPPKKNTLLHWWEIRCSRMVVEEYLLQIFRRYYKNWTSQMGCSILLLLVLDSINVLTVFSSLSFTMYRKASNKLPPVLCCYRPPNFGYLQRMNSGSYRISSNRFIY